MKLTLLERAVGLSLLPEKGDFSTLRTVQEARNNLALSEAEVKEFDYKSEGNKMSWNEAGNEEREIKLSKLAERILADKLKDLNDKKELVTNQMSLYEKLI